MYFMLSALLHKRHLAPQEAPQEAPGSPSLDLLMVRDGMEKASVLSWVSVLSLQPAEMRTRQPVELGGQCKGKSLYQGEPHSSAAWQRWDLAA